MLLILSLCSYIFLGLLLRGNVREMPAGDESWEPSVSVIISARNEEASLPACLASLVSLDYPEDKLEIVVVNDASTDHTAQIIDSFQRAHPTLQRIDLAFDEKEKAGKAGALLKGIDKSSGEILFFTDADCLVSRDWIREMLKGFRPEIGVVGGFTLIGQAQSLFAQMQALDWHFLLTIASAASHLNKPISWVGNNLALRRSAYEQTGGYRRLSDSFVEDFALIHAIDRQTHWRCRFYASPKSIVRTLPAQTVARLYAQRKRWSTGIVDARPFCWWIMITVWALHVSLLVSLFCSAALAIVTLLIKCGVDIFLFRASGVLLGESRSASKVIIYEPYYILSSLLLPISMLFDRRVTWKGAKIKNA